MMMREGSKNNSVEPVLPLRQNLPKPRMSFYCNSSRLSSDVDSPENQHEPEPKRRGRPRGSKNRRGRVSSQTVVVKSSPPSHQPLHATGQGTNPPQLPEVTAQNQQYYEFQWRVLNLCAEFYGAAEELVVSVNLVRLVSTKFIYCSERDPGPSHCPMLPDGSQ